MNNIMMQAMGAMMRGESPQAFMQNLAQTNPQLQGLDLNNLYQTGEQVCKQNGVDVNAITEKINAFIGSK